MTAEPSEPPLGEPVEHTPIDLLAGPHDKVSITMPAALKARVAEAASAQGTNFSSYVADVLAREERRLLALEFFAAMDAEFGSPPSELDAWVDKALEGLWAQSAD
jgi:hypothetical protein